VPSAPLEARRLAGRAVGSVRRSTGKVGRVTQRFGFPWRAPAVPKGVVVPKDPPKVGADFDTAWARTTPARVARAAIVEGPLRLAIRAVADPAREGLDRLEDLRRAADDADDPLPVIFAANHHSHLDAPMMITAVPEPWRRRLVVAAAADYFFATRVSGAASALALGAIPIDRSRVNRRSADLAQSLLEDGWSLLIFPEGGRSPDGWGQPFRGGAAFLSVRTGVPVVPVHLEGTGSILGKGMKRPKPGRTIVTFGAPLRPADGEDARRMGDRIERAVAELGDESLTDWYSARRRAARGETPSLVGPAATGWRRAWALGDRRAKGRAGARRRQQRRWPQLD
jgi:1-acyl-sn-glycerol-3-phosphate acyltransferase